MSEKLPFAVMAKPVGSRCNMRCRYCYYLDMGKYSAHAKQTRMSFDLLEKLIRQTVAASPGPVVSFTWHGGEPTLAGLDFYKKAVELQRKYLPAGWTALNNLQTNGLLLNDAWCAFLKENRFDVGLSVDGSEAVHDANRRDLGGKPTFERVRAAAARLKRRGIEPDLLCTVNSMSEKRPLEVYRALRELGSGWIQFIPIVARGPDGTVTPESVSPEGYGGFLIACFDEWVTRDLGRLDVQLFAEAARVLAGGEASLCTLRPTCGRVPVVEEDGAVYACDHFVDPEHRIGSLSGGNLDKIVNSEAQLSFGRRKGELTAQCRRCPHLTLCNGGCPKDRFALSADGEAGQHYLCPGMTGFFDHAAPVLRRMTALSRQGLGPEAIMNEMRQYISKEGSL